MSVHEQFLKASLDYDMLLIRLEEMIDQVTL